METAADIVRTFRQRFRDFIEPTDRYSGDQIPEFGSAAVSGRDMEEGVTERDMSDGGHGAAIGDPNHILDPLRGYLGEPYDDSSLDMPDWLGFELPVPSESFWPGELPASLMQAGANFLDQLPDISLDDIPNVIGCNICMEHFGSTEDPESRIQLPCGHIMGRKCISRWLETSNSCPLCRHVLFEQERSTINGQETLNRSWHDLEPRLQALVRSLTTQQQHYLLRALQESAPPEAVTFHREQVEIPGVTQEEVEAYRAEYYEITLQRAVIDERLTEIEMGDGPLTSQRAMELRELEEDNEVLRARLDSFHVRYRNLINVTLFN